MFILSHFYDRVWIGSQIDCTFMHTAYNILAQTTQKTQFLIVVVQLLPWVHVCEAVTQ
jgi:predicted glycosyltransferase